MDNYISQIVNVRVGSLKSTYESNKLIGHQGIKGSVNETLLLELIRSLIPTKYKLTKGIIQDSAGFQSNESDIILYDNEILPAILFGNDLGFIPAESVKYIFEVKSTLNATELKTTINKFSNLKKCDGYEGNNVLFAFSSDLSKKTELERLYENHKENFNISPQINILGTTDRGYFFFKKKKVYIKDLIDKNEFAKLSHQQTDGAFKSGGLTISTSKNTDMTFKIEGDLIINGLNYEELYVNIYRWYGINSEEKSNCDFLSFLSGISNTLSKKEFGKYLLSNCSDNLSIYSECVVDMWGNSSFKHNDFTGYSNTKLIELKFKISLNKDSNTNKIEIYPLNLFKKKLTSDCG